MVAVTETSSNTTVVHADDLPFVEIGPGIEMKLFRTGLHDATWEAIFRFQPGTVLPTHHHTGSVHAFTISGRWGYREYDWEADAGSYAYEEPRSVHTLEVSADADEPAVVFFVISGAMLIFMETLAETLGVELPEGEAEGIAIQDGTTMLDMYRAACEVQGKPAPDAVIVN